MSMGRLPSGAEMATCVGFVAPIENFRHGVCLRQISRAGRTKNNLKGMRRMLACSICDRN